MNAVRRIETVLKTLNDARVRYLIAGGVAVVLHGYLRATADLDLVVQLTPDNPKRALGALGASEFRPRAPVPMQWFADTESRRSWIETENLQVFSLWHPELPGFELDLSVEDPFDFDDAWDRRVDVTPASTHAPVVGFDDLLLLKRASGRPTDPEDVAALESLPEGKAVD